MTFDQVMCFLPALFLAACGGGGDSVDQTQAAAAACRPVTVALYGDSTDAAPEARTSLQTLMDSRFGAGRVVVSTKAVSGTTSSDLPAVGGESLAVVNFGINDARAFASIDTYKANLRRLYRPGVIFKTPNPIWGHTYDPTDVDDQAYVQAMREVATELDAPLIETNGYVLGLQDWHALVADGLHPTPVLYGKIAEGSMSTLAPLVTSLACQ